MMLGLKVCQGKDARNCLVMRAMAYMSFLPKIPVYIGKSNDLRGRIQEYAYDGSHLDDKINDAVERRDHTYVRYAKCSTARKAEKAEKHYLENYNYKWNSRMNTPAKGYKPS